VLGVLLPLSVAAPGATYAAVFWPGEDGMARLSQAGGAWRVLRVVAAWPVPILAVARVGNGPPPMALLLPVPSAPGCLFADTGSRAP
jgi:hypothetical protein